jgi:hypothetical protein
VRALEACAPVRRLLAGGPQRVDVGGAWGSAAACVVGSAAEGRGRIIAVTGGIDVAEALTLDLGELFPELPVNLLPVSESELEMGPERRANHSERMVALASLDEPGMGVLVVSAASLLESLPASDGARITVAAGASDEAVAVEALTDDGLGVVDDVHGRAPRHAARRAHRLRPAAPVVGRHDAGGLRAAVVPREAGGTHPTTARTPGDVPRCAGAGGCHEQDPPRSRVVPSPPAPRRCRGGAGSSAPARRSPWAELLKRVFAVDALSCHRCGGRREVLALITEGSVVRAILECLGLPTEGPVVHPARGPRSLF